MFKSKSISAVVTLVASFLFWGCTASEGTFRDFAKTIGEIKGELGGDALNKRYLVCQGKTFLIAKVSDTGGVSVNLTITSTEIKGVFCE